MKEMKESKGWSISSLVCGILGLIVIGVLMPYFAIVFSILAIVFYAKDKTASGLAKGGLVTGIIGVCLNSAMLLFMLVWFLAVGSLV